MENIFTCNLNVNNKKVEYHVVFENEQYLFCPEGDEAETFSFRREDDKWIDEIKTRPELRKEALEALDSYLLSQN